MMHHRVTSIPHIEKGVANTSSAHDDRWLHRTHLHAKPYGTARGSLGCRGRLKCALRTCKGIGYYGESNRRCAGRLHHECQCVASRVGKACVKVSENAR
eukprot:1182387-Prorocentrum_minimum.AAC.3